MQNDSADIVQQAENLARQEHKGQIYDPGKDYFSAHIQVVAGIIKMVTTDPEIVAATYLHDLIEDTKTTYEDLVNKFGKRVADLVLEVTKEPDRDPEDPHYPNLRSRDGIMIKFADRLCNISRMESWDEEKKKAYIRRSKFWKP